MTAAIKPQPLVWPEGFTVVYNNGIERYRKGASGPNSVFTAEERAFLATLGCSAQELFDFVEDGCNGGEPSFEAAFLVTALRRDYFLTVQKGKPSGQLISMAHLPAKSAAMGGIPWLPRIIEKAKAKLRGEMPPELMYGCGGDRAFLSEMGLSLPDFLKFVWDSNGDTEKILDYVQQARGR